MLVSAIRKYSVTAYLFTKSDFKTIVLPVTGFALALSVSTASYATVFGGVVWTWLHLLQTTVANQSRSISEDVINKPWRPLPAARMTEDGAKHLRWAICSICLLVSAVFGVVAASAILTMVTVMYDDLKFSKHWFGRAICNSMGYLCFEFGATYIIGGSGALNLQSVIALVCSGYTIMTTIHAQDFADVEGDKISGRQTLPIAFPFGARAYIVVALISCSALLSSIWSVDEHIRVLFNGMGLLVAIRFYFYRSQGNDERTYLLYNIWLCGAHLLPICAHGN